MASRRLGILLVGVPVALVCLSGVASAHVTVQPTSAAVGSETVLTFSVPTESDNASTVKIVIALPTSTPIPVVTLQPVPGWTAQVITRRLPKPVQTDDGPVSSSAARITWAANDKASAIAPDRFQQFTISAGPLPSAKRLVFKVLQYYSDGSVVRWIDPPTNGPEPDHPAPTVTLGNSDSVATASAVAGGSSDASGSDSGTGWIAVAAFVAGLLGLAAGTAALVIARRSGTGPAA